MIGGTIGVAVVKAEIRKKRRRKAKEIEKMMIKRKRNIGRNIGRRRKRRKKTKIPTKGRKVVRNRRVHLRRVKTVLLTIVVIMNSLSRLDQGTRKRNRRNPRSDWSSMVDLHKSKHFLRTVQYSFLMQ
jgi:hypothetical protein